MAWCRSFSSAVTWTQTEEDLHKIVVRARRATKANRIAGLLLRLFLCLKQQGLHLASRFGFRVEEGLRVSGFRNLGIEVLRFRDRQPPATCCPILFEISCFTSVVTSSTRFASELLLTN